MAAIAEEVSSSNNLDEWIERTIPVQALDGERGEDIVRAGEGNFGG